MTAVLMLIPVALLLGGLGLLAFMWSMRSGQFEDLDGAANRILFDDDDLPPSSAGTGGDVAAPAAASSTAPSAAPVRGDALPPRSQG